MDSTDHRSFAALNDGELDGLVDVIVEQFGSTLDRAQFADEPEQFSHRRPMAFDGVA